MPEFQAVRGMNDITPEKIPYWQCVEAAACAALSDFAFQEIRFPIVESTALFKRSVGSVTDIAQKEMYTFDDRNGDSLSLRPEGTAGCVRAGIENGLFYNQIQKLWYHGPMFRHERPQKGRYRQFSQLGAEIVGVSSPDADIELILLSFTMWRSLELENDLTLELNTIGTKEERETYCVALVDFCKAHFDDLDDDSRERLDKNPLRILDSKNPAMKALLENAPTLDAYLGDESKSRFAHVRAGLDALNIPYHVNPCLVRGLDYYCHTVFEWTTNELGAQGTVCAGGRYDGLVEQLGGKPAPAVGFAMGYERLVLMVEKRKKLYSDVDVYICALGDLAEKEKFQAACRLRADELLAVKMDLAGGSMKSQMKRAEKSHARWTVIITDDHLKNSLYQLKDMQTGKLQPMEWADLESLIDEQMAEFMFGD
jgi:histidyl-tRNA synthetase